MKFSTLSMSNHFILMKAMSKELTNLKEQLKELQDGLKITNHAVHRFEEGLWTCQYGVDIIAAKMGIKIRPIFRPSRPVSRVEKDSIGWSDPSDPSGSAHEEEEEEILTPEIEALLESVRWAEEEEEEEETVL